MATQGHQILKNEGHDLGRGLDSASARMSTGYPAVEGGRSSLISLRTNDDTEHHILLG